MPDLNKIFLFRITHIENISHILQNGITHVSSVNANPNFMPIGDSSLIATRNDFLLDNGIRLGGIYSILFRQKSTNAICSAEWF
jgi:hypothetical protein